MCDVVGRVANERREVSPRGARLERHTRASHEGGRRSACLLERVHPTSLVAPPSWRAHLPSVCAPLWQVLAAVSNKNIHMMLGLFLDGEIYHRTQDMGAARAALRVQLGRRSPRLFDSEEGAPPGPAGV